MKDNRKYCPAHWHIGILIILVILVTLATSCSTTKNLPEGQVLYTGIKKTEIENESKTEVGKEAVSEVKAAIAKAPNNSLFGSSSVRHPFAFGLWIYNAFVNSESGIGRWIFRKFAADPVYISTVNPELRTKAATNLLHDYGFFNGTADYEVIPNNKNPRKAGINYYIDMQNPWFLDSIQYRNFPQEAMDIIMSGRGPQSLLRKGAQFNVIDLENERQRISNRLRNRGYYYFRPNVVTYQADTTRMRYLVDLRVMPQPGLPPEVHKQWRIGDISVHLFGVYGEVPNDSTQYKDITIYYHDKLKVRPKVLNNRVRMKPGELYAQRQSTNTQERFAELGIFRYTEMQFTPKDSTDTNDLLNLDIKTGFDLPYDSQFEVNVATKSNDYAGPGIAYTVTRRNIFRGGESLTVGVKGSYEWQTKSAPGASHSRINSYEIGMNTSLNFPRIIFPWLGSREWNSRTSTTISLNADLLNRAHFFRMLSFGGNITYNFQPNRVSTHSITPFRLTFNVLQSHTAEFDSILNVNKALAKSMENQFVPAMSYTYTYDDGPLLRRKNHFWFQSSITSAGNITSGIYSLVGKGKDSEKNLLGSKMAQFVKVTSEVRYTWNINNNHAIATRFIGGLLYPYGPSKEGAPYSEQFFIGGANSIRAFTIRTIGPGTYVPQIRNRYSYLDQTGEIKLEANVEYRFRIIKNLLGAVFLDAGNIWLVREDEERPGGKFNLRNFPDNIALGTGAGLRYDLSYLVIRLDCGVALHVPYETSKKGYYNIPKFKDGIGLHLAIGYPF